MGSVSKWPKMGTLSSSTCLFSAVRNAVDLRAVYIIIPSLANDGEVTALHNLLVRANLDHLAYYFLWSFYSAFFYSHDERLPIIAKKGSKWTLYAREENL